MFKFIFSHRILFLFIGTILFVNGILFDIPNMMLAGTVLIVSELL